MKCFSSRLARSSHLGVRHAQEAGKHDTSLSLNDARYGATRTVTRSPDAWSTFQRIASHTLVWDQDCLSGETARKRQEIALVCVHAVLMLSSLRQQAFGSEPEDRPDAVGSCRESVRSSSVFDDALMHSQQFQLISRAGVPIQTQLGQAHFTRESPCYSPLERSTRWWRECPLSP